MTLFELCLIQQRKKVTAVTIPIPGVYLVGFTDSLALSTDGINYTPIHNGGNYCSVLFKNRIFVSYPNSILAYSQELTRADILNKNVSMSQISVADQGINYIRSMATNGTVLVAVLGSGGTNTIVYSYDGLTWTGSGMVFSYAGTVVKWVGNKFIAAGHGTSGTLFSSPDGISWTQMMNASVFGSYNSYYGGYVSDFVVNGNTIVCSGYKGDASSTTVAVSNDAGISWTAMSNPMATTRTDAVVWDGFRYLMAGYSGLKISESVDGVTNWTAIPVPREIFKMLTYKQSVVGLVGSFNSGLPTLMFFAPGNNTIVQSVYLATSSTWLTGSSLTIYALEDFPEAL